MGVVCVLLLYEHSPPLYHAYIAMTIFLWTQIFSEYKFLMALWRYLGGRKCSYFLKLIATCIFSILILELLVWLPNTLKWYSCLDVINMLLRSLNCFPIILSGTYSGDKLYWEKNLHMVFHNFGGHLLYLSIQVDATEIWSTYLFVACMLASIRIYSHASWNSRNDSTGVSHFIVFLSLWHGRNLVCSATILNFWWWCFLWRYFWKSYKFLLSVLTDKLCKTVRGISISQYKMKEYTGMYD